MTKPGSTKQIDPWTPQAERVANVGVRVMGALNKWVYRASGGRIGNKFTYGAPVCLLTSRGAKSGRVRTTPLIFMADEERVIFVASKGGMSQSPHWYFNLEAHPQDVEVTIGTETRKMASRRASDEEKEALWPRLCEVYPDYEDYQARTERNIPVMILSPR
jgi:deazaflavin-dependent oxidoreductase (nitroreductase family)